jgi:serine/threonine protein kinase
LEYLDGHPLSNEIGKAKRLDLSRFQRIFSQILSALAYAHSQNIVHRDIKPGNILLAESDGKLIAKLIDFGIARVENGEGQKTLTATNHLIGSPMYMSPEQCRGAKIEKVSDIYSIACVMYESLTGKPPHEAETPMETMYQHMSNDAPKLENLGKDRASKQLGKLIDLCLSREPALRPQSAEDVLKELNSIFDLHEGSFGTFAESRPKPVFNMLAFASFVAAVLIAGIVLCAKYFIVPSGGQSLLSKQNDRKILKLSQDMERLELRYQQTPDPNRTHIAFQLMDKLLELAQAKMNLKKDYRAALHIIDRAKQISDFTEFQKNKDYLASAMLLRGQCLLALNQKADAEKALLLGFDCHINNSHIRFRVRPELAEELAKIDIEKRDFSKASYHLEHMLKSAQSSDLWESRSYAAAKLDAVKEGCLRGSHFSDFLLDYLKKNPAHDSNERLAILSIFNLLAEKMVDDSFYTNSGTFEEIQQLAENISPDTANAKPVLSKSYLILAQFEAHNGDSEKAAKFKNLSESVAR